MEWVNCSLSNILNSTKHYVYEIITANFKLISCKHNVNTCDICICFIFLCTCFYAAKSVLHTLNSSMLSKNMIMIVWLFLHVYTLYIKIKIMKRKMQCTDCIAIQCYALNERYEGNIIYKLMNIMYMYVSKKKWNSKYYL